LFAIDGFVHEPMVLSHELQSSTECLVDGCLHGLGLDSFTCMVLEVFETWLSCCLYDVDCASMDDSDLD
jgi:hypothetical protein